MRYKGWLHLDLDMQDSGVDREQGRESKDIQYGLGLTAAMLVESVQIGVSERSLATQSGVNETRGRGCAVKIIDKPSLREGGNQE